MTTTVVHVLRHGEVVAAITSSADAVPGCRQVRLGAIRYVPVAAAGLARRFSCAGEVDWENLPVLRYDTRDDLQETYLAARGLSSTLPPTTDSVSTISSTVAVVGVTRRTRPTRPSSSSTVWSGRTPASDPASTVTVREKDCAGP